MRSRLQLLFRLLLLAVVLICLVLVFRALSGDDGAVSPGPVVHDAVSEESTRQPGAVSTLEKLEYYGITRQTSPELFEKMNETAESLNPEGIQ
jgi:hypothetical protein